MCSCSENSCPIGESAVVVETFLVVLSFRLKLEKLALGLVSRLIVELQGIRFCDD